MFTYVLVSAGKLVVAFYEFFLVSFMSDNSDKMLILLLTWLNLYLFSGVSLVVSFCLTFTCVSSFVTFSVALNVVLEVSSFSTKEVFTKFSTVFWLPERISQSSPFAAEYNDISHEAGDFKMS